MTPRRWYAIATMLLMVAFSINASAANRVLNGDFELIGEDPCDIPDWTDDHLTFEFVTGLRVCTTLQLDGIGVDDSVGLLVIGAEVRRSADLFDVVPGEGLVLTFDVFEVRNDNDGHSGNRAPRGDSVVALEFKTATGGSGAIPPLPIFPPQHQNELEAHCDQYVDYADDGILNNSDSCVATDNFVSIKARDDSTAFECATSINELGELTNHECTKYDAILGNHADPSRIDCDFTTSTAAQDQATDPLCCYCILPNIDNTLYVPADAAYARVLIGGSLAFDRLDPLFGAGLSSPTSVTIFDNIVVDDA